MAGCSLGSARAGSARLPPLPGALALPQWDDVAGLESAKDALKEAVILPVKFPQFFTGKRKPWSGILLYGPPGTGKSYLAKVRCVCGGGWPAAGWPMQRRGCMQQLGAPPTDVLALPPSLAAPPPGGGHRGRLYLFQRLLLGPGVQVDGRVREACQQPVHARAGKVAFDHIYRRGAVEGARAARCACNARRAPPPLDPLSARAATQIDALCSSRGEGESEAARRIKTEFLVQMQGVGHGSEEQRVLMLGATNLPQALDQAIRRRFDKRVYIPLPEAPARATMFKIHLGDTPNSLTAADYEELGRRTEGFSGSDISVVVKDVLMQPVRKTQVRARRGRAPLASHVGCQPHPAPSCARCHPHPPPPPLRRMRRTFDKCAACWSRARQGSRAPSPRRCRAWQTKARPSWCSRPPSACVTLKRCCCARGPP